jgi:hypothetical protein
VKENMKKPVDNPNKLQYENINIEYFDVQELVQGGPETGKLKINEEVLTGNRFGTNVIFYKKFLITSTYKKSFGLFTKKGFTPCAIQFDNRKIIEIGEPEILFMPFRIENEMLFYFIDLKNEKVKTLSLKELI